MFARQEPGEIAALLRFAAIAPDLVDAQVGMRAIGQANRGRGAADLLHHQAMFEIAEACAAIGFLDGDTMQAECAHAWPQVARESVGAIDVIGARLNGIAGEGARCVADQDGGFVEAEIQGWILRHVLILVLSASAGSRHRA